MYKKHFGKRNKMSFNTPEDYFETLGFLAKSDGSISLVWEHNENQGAWGSEGRIHCYKNISKFPAPLRQKFTAGTGTVLHRINCNEFVENIINNHNFTMGKNQNTANIRTTIPKQYIKDFDRGLNL